MRTESIFQLFSLLCSCHDSSAFTNPYTALSTAQLRRVHSLHYFPENDSWDNQGPPQQYGVRDSRWDKSIGFDERTVTRPSWSQTDFHSRDMMNFDHQFSEPRQYRQEEEPGQEMNIGFGGANPPFGQREYQQQYRDDVDRGSDGERSVPFRQSSFYGRRQYDWNEPQIPLDRQDEEYILRQRQRRGYENDYFTEQIYYDQQNDQNYAYENDSNQRLLRRKALDREQQYRWPDNNGIGFEDNNRRSTTRGMIMSPLRGFEIMDRVLNDMMDGIRMVHDVMDRMSFDIETKMYQDQASLDDLLYFARGILIADPAVGEMLGDSIRLGMPTSQSAFSSIINGARTSQLELIIPIKGSQNMGQVRILADEEGISQLEVGVGEHIIDVQAGRRRRYNSRKLSDDEVIDATVVE